MQEKRLPYRLNVYWESLKKSNEFPPFEQFNPAAIEDLWTNCFVVSLHPGTGISYKYDYMGDTIKELYGQDMTGMVLDYKMHQFPGAVVLKRLQEIVTDKKPIDDAGYMTGPDGAMIKYRSCFLPFGKDNELTHVLVGLSHRMF